MPTGGQRPRWAGSRRSPDGDFASVLAAAITRRGVTLTELHRRLTDRGVAVSVGTLSYWRSGARQPEGAASIAAVEQLEEILRLPRGALMSRIGPSRRTGAQRRRVPYEELVDLDPRTRRSLAKDGPDLEDHLDAVSVHATVDVDRERRVERVVYRMRVRANTDGAERTPVVLRLQHPSERPVQFRALGGGRLESLDATLAPDLYGTNIILDRPLRLGETALLEYEMVVPDGSGFDRFEHHLITRADEVVVWVRFHPEALPATCVLYSKDARRTTAAPVDLVGLTTVHHSMTSFGPGIIGIRWEW